MMQIHAVPFSALGSRHLEAWSRIQGSDSTFDSPFFCPEFSAAVASVRDDVCVGVMEQEGTIVGLFPFQRSAWGEATPVAGEISQFHGVIIDSTIGWSADELLRSCNLSSWVFSHLPLTQLPFQQHYQCVGESPCIDLTNGFDEYCAEKQRSGKVIEQANRKARKLEREVGPLRFELHDTSNAAFQCLLAWKSEQHQRTNVVDAFACDWLVTLLDRIRLTHYDSFAGLVSALYAGDHLVAVHLGMRSKRVAHSWYPAYDTAFGKYSPGITLLLKMAEALADVGVQRIDFAAGQQIYKTRFMNGAIGVAKGVADRSRLKACVRRNAGALRERVNATPLAVPMRIPVRMLRRVGKWWTDQ